MSNPYVDYISMCSPKKYGLSAVLVIIKGKELCLGQLQCQPRRSDFGQVKDEARRCFDSANLQGTRAARKRAGGGR